MHVDQSKGQWARTQVESRVQKWCGPAVANYWELRKTHTEYKLIRYAGFTTIVE